MTQRSPGPSSRVAPDLPAAPQVAELLGAAFAQAGYEIEDVLVDASAKPPRITVVADGDTPLDLDAVAELSRAASDLLDTLPAAGAPYVLEVTSPGVERPLTAEKHFRRAHGRKVAAQLSDGTELTGRVAGVDGGTVQLVVRAGRDWAVRAVPLADISKAVVQVEFSSPSKRELELVADRGAEAAQ